MTKAGLAVDCKYNRDRHETKRLRVRGPCAVLQRPMVARCTRISSCIEAVDMMSRPIQGFPAGHAQVGVRQTPTFGGQKEDDPLTPRENWKYR